MTQALLLDSNVVSELRKLNTGRINPSVLRWAEATDLEVAFISAITLFELERGALLAERRDQNQGRVLRTWLDLTVLPTFDGRVLPLDQRIALKAATLHVPDPKPLADSLLAATALVHGLTMVTRNIADFTAVGLRLVNPWNF